MDDDAASASDGGSDWDRRLRAELVAAARRLQAPSALAPSAPGAGAGVTGVAVRP